MPEPLVSLAELAETSYVCKTARECLSEIVIQKSKAGEALFPDIFGLDMEKRRLVEVMAAGKGVLLTGEYGVAKTDLARHVLELLNEYFDRESAFAVEKCPVQEDPMILLQYVKCKANGGARYPAGPCPICRKMIKDTEGDLSKIRVRRIERLIEGTGFARVQGGGDVLPEEIVGSYNLLKLARIGDPFDPRVFEPGKIGQSSRGLLFVDEIGKLPENAQHALIQASQESIVTPSKSRETFPVDFLMVATTNPIDEEYICGAVRDRLVSLKIPPAGAEDEVRIVRKEIDRLHPRVWVPGIFLKLAVEVVRSLRGYERLELGPRASIHAGLIGRSSAILEGRRVVSYCDIKEGIYTAILGKALFEDKSDVENRIDGLFPEISDYLVRSVPEVGFAEIVRAFRVKQGVEIRWSASRVKEMIAGSGPPAALESLAGWVYRNEPVHKHLIHEVIAEYMQAFERGCVK